MRLSQHKDQGDDDQKMLPQLTQVPTKTTILEASPVLVPGHKEVTCTKQIWSEAERESPRRNTNQLKGAEK